MIRLAIFDWDGTLVDSVEHIVSCMQAAARQTGMPVPAPEAVANIIGLGMAEALRALFPDITDQQTERMREAYAGHFFNQGYGSVPLFPGVRDGLARLRREGVQLAVATGKSRRGLDHALRETGLCDYFQWSRCADETASKPDPLMLNELLHVSGRPADEAAMVGDTEYDLAMAAAAGVSGVGVLWGVHDQGRLLQHHPVALVSNFDDLVSVLLEERDSSHE